MAQGIFHGDPWALRISGGFASPVAAELLPQADVVLAFGAALNHWTTRHGELIGPQARVVQVDVEPRAIGANRRIDLAVVGDTRAVAEAVEAELAARGHSATGYRTDEVGAQLAARRWRDEPYEPSTADGYVDPRDFSIALADLLPSRKTVAIDSGHFMGWPAMFLDVEDARHWVFMNGFQAVGLGLAGAIGAAVAEPERSRSPRSATAGCSSRCRSSTARPAPAVRLLVAVYDDAAYGAEVHHFGPMGHATDTVRFPDADLAAAARAHGVEAITVRHVDDLDPSRTGCAAAAGRCSSTRRSIPTSAPTGCRKRSAPADTTTEEQHVVHVLHHHRRTARSPGRRLREGRRPHAAAQRDTPVIACPSRSRTRRRSRAGALSRYDDAGPAWAWDVLEIGEHTGTHFDAPIHWISGKDGKDVASVGAEPARRPGGRHRQVGRVRRGPRLPADGRRPRGMGGRARRDPARARGSCSAPAGTRAPRTPRRS